MKTSQRTSLIRGDARRRTFANSHRNTFLAALTSALRLLLLPSAVAMVSVVLLGGCWRDIPGEQAAEEAQPREPVVVQAATVQRVTLRPTLDLVGSITPIPERTSVISPQVGGWVEKLHVVEGQSVHADDLIVQLDASLAHTAVKRASAVVAEKTAQLTRLKRGYLPQEVEGARQDADKAAAAADGLRSELAALKDLLDRQEISAVLYQTKSKALKSADAALASAQERVKLLEAGTRPELIAEAQGQLDAAKADLEQTELNLKWCAITSPIDGVVVQLLARQGQFFERAVPLATIMDLTNVFVQLRIPSRDFGKVGKGTVIEIHLASLSGRVFRGQVARISGQADPLTGNVIVFAAVKNQDGSLRPGLGCKASISLPEVPNVLAIPIAAIADHSGTPVVTVIRSGKAHEVEVETGVETHDLIEIVKGLSPGDTVATAGGYGLPDGCPVKVADTSQTGPTE